MFSCSGEITTVMSISNRKKANWINEIGDELAKKYQMDKEEKKTASEKFSAWLVKYRFVLLFCAYG